MSADYCPGHKNSASGGDSECAMYYFVIQLSPGLPFQFALATHIVSKISSEEPSSRPL